MEEKFVKELEKLSNAMKKILDQKYKKYDDIWKTEPLNILRDRLYNKILVWSTRNLFDSSSDAEIRMLTHIANYILFLFIRLKG